MSPHVVPYAWPVALYRLAESHDLVEPALIAAFDSWVDAGSAASSAAEQLAAGGDVVVTWDADQIVDYRARRPTLEIVDGRPGTLTWPELVVRRNRIGSRDVLVFTGPEPDYRWQELAASAVQMARDLGVVEWISLGSIPAAVPHTRSVTIMGTESRPGLLRGDVTPGPAGILKVPAAAISVLDMAVARAGIPTVGYFAQVPHYVTGAYPAAAMELLLAVGRHIGEEVPLGSLPGEAEMLRSRLDLDPPQNREVLDGRQHRAPIELLLPLHDLIEHFGFVRFSLQLLV